VSHAIEKGKSLAELGITEYQGFSPLFGDDVYSITVESSLAARDNIGGTAPGRVAEALSRAKDIVAGR
jgi:argininosuccinate lyase